MNNKQGISTIVATVLIVLITVAAVTILWAAISPLVGENLEQSTNCLSVQNAISIDTDVRFTNVTIDSAAGPATECGGLGGDCDLIHLRVERAANTPDLQGFEVLIERDGSTLDGSGNGLIVSDLSNLLENGARVYTFRNADGAPVAYTGDITAGESVRIAVAPQVLIDGVATSCTASQFVDLT